MKITDTPSIERLKERLAELLFEHGPMCGRENCLHTAAEIAPILIERLAALETLTPSAGEVERAPANLDTLAMRWYSGFDWGAPHSSRESNFAVAGFKAGYAATLSLPTTEIRREALEEAAKVAYPDPLYMGGNVRDENGNLPPGSPYDRGRYDAARDIRTLISSGGQ